MSKELGELVVKKCTPEEFAECDIVFSGLDSDVAGDVGEQISLHGAGLILMMP
jgi:aspartate-semialdehyde dehydrogenase